MMDRNETWDVQDNPRRLALSPWKRENGTATGQGIFRENPGNPHLPDLQWLPG